MDFLENGGPGDKRQFQRTGKAAGVSLGDNFRGWGIASEGKCKTQPAQLG